MDHVEEAGAEASVLVTGGLRAKRARVVVCGTGDRAHALRLLERRKGVEPLVVPETEELTALVAAALTADAAVILVDARAGVVHRTRRDCYLCRLLGIQHQVIAVTGLELVDDASAALENIESEVRAFSAELGCDGSITCVPLNAATTAAPFSESPAPSDGAALIESAAFAKPPVTSELPFRFYVQWVRESKRGSATCAGCVATGRVRAGDTVVVLPGGIRARVRSVSSAEGELSEAEAGQAITLTLDTDGELQRGDLITSATLPAQVGDRFRCTIVWLDEEPLFPGRPYSMQIGPRTVGVTITEPRYRIAPDNLAQLAAKQLDANEVGACNIQTDVPIAFDPHVENRETGAFTLLDRVSGKTVGVGTLGFALWRSENVHWQALDVSKRVRSELKGQSPCVIWFTGLSGSGKSTIANLLERRLVLSGRHTYLLDGDNVRHGLNRDLGFTDADRVENIRRVTEVSKLMVDAGLIVLVSFISPFRAERAMARDTLGEGEFIEVFVDTPLEEAERRDPKGLYRKAREGRLKHFTGIDSPYEPPEAPEIHIRTLDQTPEEAVELVIATLRRRGKLTSSYPAAS
jgi:bifunctional enzyme CysN/CysC